MPSNQVCPRCFKTEEEDRATCVNLGNLGCPDTVDFSDIGHVLVRCAEPCGGPCGKLLAVPIGCIMKRRTLTNLGVCSFDVCRARVVLPQRNSGPAAPPPIKEAKAGGKSK